MFFHIMILDLSFFHRSCQSWSIFIGLSFPDLPLLTYRSWICPYWPIVPGSTLTDLSFLDLPLLTYRFWSCPYWPIIPWPALTELSFQDLPILAYVPGPAHTYLSFLDLPSINYRSRIYANWPIVQGPAQTDLSFRDLPFFSYVSFQGLSLYPPDLFLGLPLFINHHRICLVGLLFLDRHLCPRLCHPQLC
jgi:hypothetical protein